MTFTEKLAQIERLDQLIRLKATGPPKELARRMNISERYLYKLLNIMKEKGAPIFYKKVISSYCYHSEGKFQFNFRGDDIN